MQKLILVLLIIALSSTLSAKVIDTVTLHITLTVPEPPITAETPEGDNGRYEVEKADDTIYVTAK